MKKEELQKKYEELVDTMNSYSADFVNDYYDANSYICDCFHEFADNNTSVYYSDQKKYYDENSEECDRALLELYDGEFISKKIKNEGLYNLICFAGMLGEYETIYNDLSEDEETIKKCILIKLALEDDVELSNEDINNLEFEDIDRIDDIKDYLEGLQDEEE